MRNNIANNLRFVRTKKGLSSKIYKGQRGSSKTRGHSPPDYNLQQFREWLFSQPNFDKLYKGWVASGYKSSLIPSADRIDDYKPYTLDNLRLVTWNENKFKSFADRKNGINNKLSKAVLQYDKNGGFIKEFYSISEASRIINISSGSVSRVCSGKRKIAGGFKWKTKENAFCVVGV